MISVKPAIATSFLLLVMLICSAQGKYSTIKIYPPEDKWQKAELLGRLEIDHYTMYEGAIIAEVGERELDILRQSSSRFEILVPDVAAHVHGLNRLYFSANSQERVAMEQPGAITGTMMPTPSAFQVWGTLGGFYSFAQMNTAMNNLVTAYPGLVQKTSLGLSVEGRNIWCIKISDNVTTDEVNEPEVLYIGVQHAREAIGGSSMIFFMQYLCENYAGNPRIQALVNNREIFIIPCMNPDGWEYNRVNNPNGGGGWRKNRRNNGDGTYGVDLNRNWSTDWGNCAGASSSCGTNNSSSDVYWGPAAFSEPETQAVRNFVTTHHIVSCNDQHSFGPYYSLPFGRPTLHTGSDTLTIMQQQYYNYIPAAMGKYNGMRAGNSLQSVGYEVAGGIKDWMLKGDIGTGTKETVMGFTGEGGSGDGTGGTYGSFWPPASQIINLCKGMVYQNLQAAFAAGSYVDISDRSDIAVTATTGNFNFRIKRVGLGNDPVTVTLTPLENIISVGSPVTINSMPGYFDIVDGNISYTLPGHIQAGHRLRYAWRVETGGQTYSDTITKLFDPIQLFYDDMETGPVINNWVVSANWDYTTTLSFGGARSLTESPSGLYGQNRNDNIRCNSIFNLGDATAAYLSFWVRHRAENFRDKLQVQVSTNGTVWTPVSGKTTVQEPGTVDGSTLNGEPALTGVREDWTPEVFDLSAYLGQASIRFRFVFTSDANTTGYDFQVDEGFNIDNIKLIKSNIALVTLPIRFISLNGQLKPGNTIRLNWEVITDAEHDHFVVEESSDGLNFIPSGTVAGNGSGFTDLQIYSGNNYYRVKAIDKNGVASYSKVINVVNKTESVDLYLYPNPVQNELRVRLRLTEPDQVKIRVADILGNIIYTGKFYADASIREFGVQTGGWPARTYFITVIGRNDQVLGTQAFIKQ